MARKRKPNANTGKRAAAPPPPRNWRLVALGAAIFAVGLIALIAALQLN